MDSRQLMLSILRTLAFVVAGWIGIVFLLPILLPFAIGYLLAMLVEPLVKRLKSHSRLPRWLCSGICVSVLLAVLGTLVFFLCKTICMEFTSFVRQVPQLLSSLSGPMERLKQWLLELASKFPDGLGAGLQEGINNLFKSSSGLVETGYTKLFSWATTTLSALPNAILFLVTMILSSFMISAELPSIISFSKTLVPQRWKGKSGRAVAQLKNTLGGWVKAQLKLMTVTAFILTFGFMVINIQFPLLFGVVIALIDALPVFGTGTILIPWGLIMFMRGQPRCGLGLIVLYGITALTRTALEPQMLGKQIGLNPLLTLIALYAGFRLMGILGMIVFPVGALLIKQIWDHTPKKAE